MELEAISTVIETASTPLESAAGTAASDDSKVGFGWVVQNESNRESANEKKTGFIE